MGIMNVIDTASLVSTICQYNIARLIIWLLVLKENSQLRRAVLFQYDNTCSVLTCHLKHSLSYEMSVSNYSATHRIRQIWSTAK